VVVSGDRPGPARLGLAIAKKQVRRAVDRNRIKRIVRETFRRHRARLPGVDLVVMARAAASTADNRRLAASLERHFTRIGGSSESPQDHARPRD
jgi:ribonuclease P protein component